LLFRKYLTEIIILGNAIGKVPLREKGASPVSLPVKNISGYKKRLINPFFFDFSCMSAAICLSRSPSNLRFCFSSWLNWRS
jgi:hypothetical protein